MNNIEITDQKIELQGVTLLHLNEIRKWSKFFSILGYVGTGVLLLVGLMMIVGGIIGSSSMDREGLGIPIVPLGIGYIIFSAISFFPALYLYRFSIYAHNSLVQIGSGTPSNEKMAEAFVFLNKYFRYIGVLTIVLVGVYIIGMIGVAIALAIR